MWTNWPGSSNSVHWQINRLSQVLFLRKPRVSGYRRIGHLSMDFFVAFLWRWSSWSSRSLLRQALAVFHRTSGNLWDNLWDTLWAVWTTGVTQESERVMHSNAEICTTFLLELSQLHRSHEIYCFTWKTILVKVRVVSGQAMLPLKLDHWFSDKLPFHGLLHSLTISSKRCHAALLSTCIVPSLWPERVLCQWRLSSWLIYSGMIRTLQYFALFCSMSCTIWLSDHLKLRNIRPHHLRPSNSS